MLRSEIINILIRANNYKSYLEIGIGDGENYKYINCENKTNVDPCFDDYDHQNLSLVENRMTSNEFFQNNSQKFDIIFIDGLHEYTQVYRDIKNSLAALNENGAIVCHDMLPPTEWHQRPQSEYSKGQEWNGDSWKAIARLRIEEEDLDIYTVNTDWGVGVIKKGFNFKHDVSLEVGTSYDYYNKNKDILMNVISPDVFRNMH